MEVKRREEFGQETLVLERTWMQLGRNGQLATESSASGEAMAELYSRMGLGTLHDSRW